ncbi:MAG: hypothetical protein HQ517_12150 [SAR324 cluster bacterium]|nr:hypothetical protein [SAR324 cluster bacterium]
MRKNGNGPESAVEQLIPDQLLEEPSAPLRLYSRKSHIQKAPPTGVVTSPFH